MASHESTFEILDENGTTIGNVDLLSIRTELDNYIRVVEHFKQEIQHLRGQVQRCQNQIKLLEARAGRR